jgi:hypothetical protein
MALALGKMIVTIILHNDIQKTTERKCNYLVGIYKETQPPSVIMSDGTITQQSMAGQFPSSRTSWGITDSLQWNFVLFRNFLKLSSFQEYR